MNKNIEHTEGNYIMGITVGTSSTGYAVINDDNEILKPVHNKYGIGARIFRTRDKAEDRRNFRSARRMLNHKKSRLKYFDDIMRPEITKIDPQFFNRLKNSYVAKGDKTREKYESILFPTKEEERAYYQQYPTVYHLQQALLTEHRQFDIREIYIALHALLKNRGHFLLETPVKNFTAETVDTETVLKDLEENLNQIGFNIKFDLNKAAEINQVLDEPMLKKEKIKYLRTLLFVKSNKDKDTDKQNKAVVTQVINALLDYKVKFNVLLNVDVDDPKEWSFNLGNSEIDIKMDMLKTKLGTTELKIVTTLTNWYNALLLRETLGEASTIAEAKVNSYKQHLEDRELFNRYISKLSQILPDDETVTQQLRDNYRLYINNRSGNIGKARKRLKTTSLTKEEFYKNLKQIISKQKELPEGREIIAKIELDNFMPKQRVRENTVIPHQLIALELNKILENQGKYYPFLIKENPSADKSNLADSPYEISQLVNFKIPYYIGPLDTPEDQKKKGIPENQRFSWLVRKEEGTITPWNFAQKVDIEKTADAFIKRMIGQDTYLFDQPVMPANSLIYQKFTVLDELNKIKVNNKKLSVSEKQWIYNELFKKYKTVSVKRLKQAFAKRGHEVYSVTGLSDPKKFNNQLSTYLDFKKILGDLMDDKSKRLDIEKIVEWSTVFEDSKIYALKLKEIEWLSEDQREALAKIRLSGWGKVSRKLLTELIPSNGNSILSTMWNTKLTFIQIISKPAFKALIEEENMNASAFATPQDLIEKAYISPDNKKAVNEVLNVVKDIVTKQGAVPKVIALKYNRNPQNESQLMLNRQKKLIKLYDSISDKNIITTLLRKQLVDSTDKKLMDKKTYLYFKQAGRDGLTGQPLDLNDLNQTSIIHILPPSLISDDSFNNIMLVKNSTVPKKGMDGAAFRFGNLKVQDLHMSVRDMWNRYKELGLIPNKQFDNLLTDPDNIDPYNKLIYTNRQLTNNNVVIKLLATILHSIYPDTTLILIKNEYVRQLRYNFDLYKLKNLNDFYHGMDAYLTAFTANYFSKVYPSLKRYFVFGEYLRDSPKEKNALKSDKELDNLKDIKHFNFLWRLLYGKDEEIISTSNVPVFKKRDLIEKLNIAYNLTRHNISQESTIKNGPIFDATRYPILERDTAKTRTLFPFKKNMDTTLYGGFSSSKNSYLCLIELIYKNGSNAYKLVGVPQRYADILKNSKQDKNLKLYSLLKNSIISSKVKDFRILKSPVRLNQVVIENGQRFLVSSPQYLNSLYQFDVSQSSKKILADYVEDPYFNLHKKTKDYSDDPTEISKRLKSVVEELLHILNTRVSIFDVGKTRNKITTGFMKYFDKLDISEQKNAVLQLLITLHASKRAGNLSKLHINSTVLSRNMILSSDSHLVFQSASGLTEYKIQVGKIK